MKAPAHPKSVTTRDIAAELNLSVSTVGRALVDDRRISPATRKRVAQKARELGYVGNVAARMMRGAPSNVVGLLVPDIRNSFYSTVAHALSRSLGTTRFRLMLSETGDDPLQELEQIRGLAAARIAGLVVVPTPAPKLESIRLLHGMPHVQLLRFNPRLGSQWFGVADEDALYRATTHLIDLGHRHIAYLGGEPTRSTGGDRLAGYLRAVGERRIGPLVKHTSPTSVDTARAAAREVLGSSSAITAIVTASVMITQAVVEEVTEQGIDVPGQLSVVGFGDEPGFSWWGPGLTTMAMPVHEVATTCSMWLRERLSGNDLDAPFRSSAAGMLIERGSTRQVGRAPR